MMLQAQPIVGGIVDDIKQAGKDVKGALKGAKDAAKSGQVIAANMSDATKKLPQVIDTANTTLKLVAGCAIGALALGAVAVLRRPRRRGV